ncbi:lytic murein transglycosylase [Nioella sp.]|uniref:lytic murein transglycosylase n=1 Tax=Nioella sp. TaxID=1912091 RepID=UPI00351672CD
MSPAPSRRTVALGLSALALSGCVAGGAGPATRDDWRSVPDPAFDRWLEGFKSRARNAGSSEATLTRTFRGVGYVPLVIERDRNQAEFNRTMEDYLAIAASDDRIAMGRAKLRQHGRTLQAIEDRFGVEKEVMCAVWGMESYYGTQMGDAPVIAALATLTFDGRRGRFFGSQLMSALRALDRGDTTLSRMRGSWAGAMGHTQIMPEVLEDYGVDFDGDGRRGCWDADPTDALATTANYIARHGWTRGQPWAVEVRLPEGFDAGLAGRRRTRSVASWTNMGVRDMDGARVPNYGEAAILIPMGVNGPALMIFANFTAIWRYNPAENYVIGIGHLADRLAGGPAFRASLPPDEHGLTRAGRIEVQQRLTAQGYDTGGSDGVIGPASRAAIRAYERSQGLPETGIATDDLLVRLRQTA